MKRNLKWIGIVLLTTMLVFGLTGCPEDPPPTTTTAKSDVATITKIQIGDDGDTVSFELADPVSEEAWNDEVGGVGSFPTVGTIVIKNGAAFGKPVTVTATHDGASVMIARWTSTTGKPTFVENGTILASLANNNVIAIEVESESTSVRNYYAFRVNVLGGVSQLGTVTVAGTAATGALTATANLGSPGDTTWPTTTGTIVLNTKSNPGKLGYTVSAGATYTSVEYGVGATEPTTLTALTTAGSAEITFVDGQFIWIKVVSQNGESKSYYKIEIQQGRVATLASLAIGGVNVTPMPDGASAMPTTATEFEPIISQPAAGFAIAPVATDPDATVKWYVGKTDPANDTAYTSPTPAKFDSDTLLCIMSTSGNGNTKLYYKFKLTLMAEGLVYYGQPVIKEGTEKFIDSEWDKVEWDFDVSRINLNEMSPTFAFLNSVVDGKNHTSARAKAMWDDTGLYIYVDVDFLDFYATSAAKQSNTVTKNVAVKGSSTLSMDNAHLSDSVEMFTNERYQAYKSGDYGNQFRVAAYSGTDANNSFQGISGNSGSRPSGVPDPVVTFRDSKQWSSWVKMDGENHKGYVVIAKVPWIYKTNASANDVFDSDGLVRTVGKTDGPKIGLEIQLNTSSAEAATPARAAILTWNGITGKSYQECGNYGQVTLVMGEGVRVIKTEPPVISAQPAAILNYTSAQLADATYTTGMSVTATGPNATAVLTYQWYRATTEAGEGSIVTGASGSMTSGTPITYKPIGAQLGEQWYYVIVTNTNTAASTGFTTATVTSSRTKVTVSAATLPVITRHPWSETYNVGATARAMDVIVAPATSPDGTYTHEWFSAMTADATTGTSVGTSPTFTPPTAAEGETYYWVEVTNTSTTGNAKAASNKALVKVVAADVEIDLVIPFTGTGPAGGQINTTAITGSYTSIQRVDLGATFDLDKYNRVTFEYNKYAADMGPATAAMVMQMKWRDTATTMCAVPTSGTETWGWDLGTVPNSGMRMDLPRWLFEYGKTIPTGSSLLPGNQGLGTGPWTINKLRYLDFETKTAAVPFLELTRITFHVNPALVGPVEVTITFNSSAKTGETGVTEAVPPTMTVTGPITTLPTPPARTLGWGVGLTFAGWNTKADGTGDAVTETSEFFENTTVYAQYTYTPGTATVDAAAGTLTIVAPPYEVSKEDEPVIQGDWHANNKVNTDGSVFFSGDAARYAGGSIRYMYPTADIADYDFVTISYVGERPSGTTTWMSFLSKQGRGDADHYTSPTTGSASAGVNLAASGSTRYAIKSAGYNSGIAFQRNGNSAPPNGIGGTIKFTQVVFSKGTRYNITFDAGYPEGETITGISAVATVAIGTLPTPADRTGYKFGGWKATAIAGGIAIGDIVTSATVMPAANLSLEAVWNVFKPALPITVDFKTANPSAIGATFNAATDVEADGSGFTYTITNYNHYVKFEVDLPDGLVLADFDKISFTLEHVSGDTNYKNANVTGAKNLTSWSAPNQNSATNVTDYAGAAQNVLGGPTTNLVFNIAKSKVLNTTTLTGKIELGVCINAGGPTTIYKISNFKIYQD